MGQWVQDVPILTNWYFTIFHFFRVLVLSDGEIKELDAPNSLLKNTESVFYSMAKDAGIVWGMDWGLLQYKDSVL